MRFTIVGRTQPPCPQCEMAKNICIAKNINYQYLELTPSILEGFQNTYSNLKRSLPIITHTDNNDNTVYVGDTNDLRNFLTNQEKSTMICEDFNNIEL